MMRKLERTFWREENSRYALRSPLVVLFWLALLSAGQAAPSPFQPLDLSRFYNASLTQAVQTAAEFPQGTQILGGTPFAIGGKLEVTGLDVASHGEFLPPQVESIPVNQKFTRIHLLHGASHGQKDGTPLANLVLHFKNGEKRVFRLAFGVHTRNWIEESGSAKALGDPNSHLVWEGSRRGTNQPVVRLYRTELDNPLPDAEVSTIDLVSLFSRATPVVFAITLQNGGDMSPLQPLPKRKMVQRATQSEDSAYRRNIAVRVTDGTAPVTNATATLTIKDDARSFFFGQYQPDSSGRFVVAYPPQQAVSLSLRVSSPGFVPATANFAAQSREPWPETLDVALKRGQPIGGLVQDEHAKPVPDANIIPFEVKKTGPQQYTRYDLDVVKSGADGRWHTALASESLSNVSFEITHPDFHTATFEHLASDILLASRSVVALQAYPRVAGVVTSADREPVTNAQLILEIPETGWKTTTSAKQNGEFSFVLRDAATNGSIRIIAFAPDYAPSSQFIGGDLQHAEIQLERGTRFTTKLVDQNEVPIPGVKISLVNWQGSTNYQWRTQTDDQGRFTWEHAPSGSVTFRFEKLGHSTHTHSMTLPHTGEYTFAYARLISAAGTVVDAETKKPIDKFTVVKRYQYRNNTVKRWNRYSTASGRKGSFSTQLGSISQAEWSLVIEAKGYEPFVSEIFTGNYSNLFALKKTHPLKGEVVTADGTPVPKAEIVLLDSGGSAYMDFGGDKNKTGAGRFRRSSSNYEIVTTDANGGFEVAPKADADFILAAHPQLGFMQMPLDRDPSNFHLVLQPWGHVHGVLRVGQKVEPYHNIELGTDYQQSMPNGRNRIPLYVYYRAKPDADGQFSFDTVPPGARLVSLRYQFPSMRTTGQQALSHSVPITVKPGETNDVVIGGTGRTVVGKVDVKFSKTSAVFAIDWHRDVHTMRFQSPPPMAIPPPISFPPNATPEERRKLIAEQNAARQALYAERARAMRGLDRTYVLVFDDEGRFEVPNVPPGNYMIRIEPTDPRMSNSYRYVGNLNTQVTVPEGNGPHNVGTLELTVNL